MTYSISQFYLFSKNIFTSHNASDPCMPIRGILIFLFGAAMAWTPDPDVAIGRYHGTTGEKIPTATLSNVACKMTGRVN